MFDFLKSKEVLLKEKLQKTIAKNQTNRSISNKQINSVAIISTEEISHYINLRAIVEDTLKVRNSKIYSYREFSKDDMHSYIHFTEKDFTKTGQIVDSSFDSFLEQEFDLLIVIADKKNLYVELAVVLSNARFKAGFSDFNSDLFDIEVAGSTNEVQPFLDELTRYLIILGKLKTHENLTSRVNL